jgi:hypothetical protein
VANSKVIYGSDFGNEIANGLAPEQYDYRFLTEGDSWMDRSSVVIGSLPWWLADAMDHAKRSVLIINIAHFGDEMRRIGQTVGGEFAGWVDFMKFDAVLLSAGGNDYIDAARDVPPGLGLLRDMRGRPMPEQGRDCLRLEALPQLIDQYLNPNFAVLYDKLRSSARNATTPLFLNLYDVPVARNAPATAGGKAWLYAAYTSNGIDSMLWPDLTESIFDSLDATISGWTVGRQAVYTVPTRGHLQPADSSSSGSSGDWINEIHPNVAGWKKLAPVWRETILSKL